METSSSTHVVIGQIALLQYKLLSYTKLLSVTLRAHHLFLDTSLYRVPTPITVPPLPYRWTKTATATATCPFQSESPLNNTPLPHKSEKTFITIQPISSPIPSSSLNPHPLLHFKTFEDSKVLLSDETRRGYSAPFARRHRAPSSIQLPRLHHGKSQVCSPSQFRA